LGTWDLFREIARKKLSYGEDTADKPRIDRDLPMGLRIGSMVNIVSADAIIAGDQLKLKVPPQDMMVMAYGSFHVGPYKGHRFYMSADSGELYTLQVVTDDKGKVDECKLFSLHDEFPETNWDFWLSETDGYIGLSMFDLKDGTRYLRVWENPTDELTLERNGTDEITHIPPVTYVETVYADPFGNEKREISYDSMMYGRDVTTDIQEYMMVSAAQESNSATVQIIIGIPMEPTSIKVLF
jgi:hypothetical protein